MDPQEWAVGVSTLSAIAAAASAGAAWRSSRLTRNASETARSAAILGAVPILVPFVNEGWIAMHNRGGSTSHNHRWTILVDDEELAAGRDTQVLPADKSRKLNLPPTEQGLFGQEISTREKRIVIELKWVTSWGQPFSSRRIYGPGFDDDHDIEVTDQNGKRLELK